MAVAVSAQTVCFTSHPQVTVHSTIETPGKVVFHVSVPDASRLNVNIGTDWCGHAYSQATSKAKTSIGVETDRESIYVAHCIVTGEDGRLKIKQIEEFTDLKAHLERSWPRRNPTVKSNSVLRLVIEPVNKRETR